MEYWKNSVAESSKNWTSCNQALKSLRKTLGHKFIWAICVFTTVKLIKFWEKESMLALRTVRLNQIGEAQNLFRCKKLFAKETCESFDTATTERHHLDVVPHWCFLMICLFRVQQLRKKCPNTELFLVRIQEIRTRNNSVSAHFSCTERYKN